jgi:hypothetical protein
MNRIKFRLPVRIIEIEKIVREIKTTVFVKMILIALVAFKRSVG